MRIVAGLLLVSVAFSWMHVTSELLLYSPLDCPPCHCTLNVTTGDLTANCSHLGLTELPALPVQTTILLLNDNNLTRLSGHTLSQLSGLRLLNVSRCGLSTISQEAFAPLGRLVSLDVSGNPDLGLEMLTTALRGFPPNASLSILNASQVVPDLTLGVAVTVDLAEALQLLPLEELVLDNNQIEAVCDGVLERLPASLTTLSVRRNRFRPGLYMFSLHKLKNVVHLAAGDQFSEFDAAAAWQHGFPPPTLRETRETHLLQKVFQSLDSHALTATTWVGDMMKWLYSTRYSACQSSHDGTAPLPSSEMAMCNSPDSVHKTLGFFMQLYFTNSSIIRLPPKLEKLELKGNRLSFPLRNLTIEAPSLRELLLARNNFSVFMGPIWGLEKLEHLDLSYGYGIIISEYFFSRFINLTSLNLYANVFGLWESFLLLPFANLTSLKYIELGENYITLLPTKFFNGLDKIEFIGLEFNSLNDWAADISHMHMLETIDIHLNYFTSIPLRLREQLDALCNEKKNKSICVIFLWYKNRYECNCNTLDSWVWLQNYPTQFHSPFFDEHMYCTLTDGTLVHIGNYENVTRLVDMLEHECTSYALMVASIVSCLLVCLGLLVGALLYRHRWRLRYLFYRRRAQVAEMMAMAAAEEGHNSNFHFDAFVSYADDDRGFVVKDMRLKLQLERGLRLCIHHRDFMPGQEIATNILDAVRCSRRTLVLLTPRLLQSYWCRYELQMARMEELHLGRRVLVLLLYQHVPPHLLNCDLLELMRRDSYVEFPVEEDEEVVEMFWENLASALLRPSGVGLAEVVCATFAVDL